MLVENILFLQKNYPMLYSEMKKYEDNDEIDLVKLEDTRSDNKTLKIIKDEQTLYLHSKYDPIREAEAVINKLGEQENIDENSHIIFYGLGLGYHIDVFARLYPNTTFSLYEPSIEVFHNFLQNKKIDDFPLRRIETIHCEYKPEEMDEFCNWTINKTDKKIIIMDLPIYKNAFEEQYTRFFDRFKAILREKRINFNTNYVFQKRWIINSITNFKEVLNTPNILMQDDSIFKGKTAILVAAGPSLNYEIENLRTIKEKGLAFIFSVGSAINTLVHNDILPDAICTYDPSEKQYMVFDKINSQNITHVPMVFGSSVGFEVLQKYKGPKLHMVTNQDTISNYLLKTKDDKQIITVRDAPSIAVVTLEMLSKLEFSTVILVGQNLAFSNNKNYAEGIDYHLATTDNQKDLLKIKNVVGEDILTNASYNSMRNQLEYYVQAFNDMKIINTTLDGAHIEGTEFIPMDTVLKELLQERVVVGDELHSKMQTNKYNNEHLISRLNLLDEGFAEYKWLLLELKNHLEKMMKLFNNRNMKQMETMYTKLDYLFNRLESNDFFKIIAMPMNRVQYDLLLNNIKDAKYDNNATRKAKTVIRFYQVYLNQLYEIGGEVDNMYGKVSEIREDLGEDIN